MRGKKSKKNETLEVINLNCKITWERRKNKNDPFQREDLREEPTSIPSRKSEKTTTTAQLQSSENWFRFFLCMFFIFFFFDTLLLFVCMSTDIVHAVGVYEFTTPWEERASEREGERKKKIDPQWQRQQQKSYRGRVPKSVTGKFTPYETFSKMKKKINSKKPAHFESNQRQFIYLFRLVRSNLLLNESVCATVSERASERERPMRYN